ncbi:MAG: hypothetical protein KatS3mg076_2000 [Candidatus Binatia bacterium]|nr:MAG: hypothetical protein KatS3mg076_2000 [Candidatus Binatia bacterium]
MRGLVFVVTLVGAVPFSPRSALSQVRSADDLCPPRTDPCIVSRAFSVAPEAVLDFGSRELRVASQGQLQGSGASFTVLARSLRVDTGGTLSSRGNSAADGGSIELEAAESVLVAGEIDVSGASGGNLRVDATRIELAGGRIRARALASEGSGGSVLLEATELELAGEIVATGASGGSGGQVEITATSAVTVRGSYRRFRRGARRGRNRHRKRRHVHLHTDGIFRPRGDERRQRRVFRPGRDRAPPARRVDFGERRKLSGFRWRRRTGRRDRKFRLRFLRTDHRPGGRTGRKRRERPPPVRGQRPHGLLRRRRRAGNRIGIRGRSGDPRHRRWAFRDGADRRERAGRGWGYRGSSIPRRNPGGRVRSSPTVRVGRQGRSGWTRSAWVGSSSPVRLPPTRPPTAVGGSRSFPAGPLSRGAGGPRRSARGAHYGSRQRTSSR